jgi:hypothetical protein
MDRRELSRIVMCAVVATVAACGGGDDDEGTRSTPSGGGQPTQPTEQQTETVSAKAQGNFVPGTELVIDLPGYATVTVPGDAFADSRSIEVAAIISPETATA